MKRMMLASSLLLLLTAGLQADVPVRNKAGTAELEIVLNEKIQVPRLLVPSKLVGQRRGDAGTPLKTIMAGLGLALAFGAGGLWMARTRSGATGLAMIVTALVLFGASAVAFADKAPSRPVRAPVANVANMFDKVEVLIVPGDKVRLIVNKAQLAKLAAAQKLAPKK